jgi:hypothetical protein
MRAVWRPDRTLNIRVIVDEHGFGSIGQGSYDEVAATLLIVGPFCTNQGHQPAIG